MSNIVSSPQSTREIPSYVRIGNSPDVFAQAKEPDVKLVIWEREVPEGVARTVRFLRETTQFYMASGEATRGLSEDVIVSFSPSPLQRAVRYLKNPRALFKSEVTSSLASAEIEDIRRGFNRRRDGAGGLAEDTLYLMNLYHQTFPQVRNTKINPFFQMSSESNGLPRVHQDGSRGEFKWRMITTYDGPETVWTPDDNVNMATFRKRDGEADIINPDRVYGMGLKSVVLMLGGSKGIFHSGPRGPNKLHRIGIILIPEMG